VKLLSATTHGVLRLLRIDTTGSRSMTEEEISANLAEGVDAGVIEQHEHQMLQNVFSLDERLLSSLMVPRANVSWLDASSTVAQCLEQIGMDGELQAHSWYPVCRGSLDHVVGLIHLGKLLALGVGFEGPIENQVQSANFVPETLSAMELLEQFRARSGRMVFVVDEYGVVQGVVTPGDLLQAITGELQPVAQVDAWATPREDGSWLLDGRMPVSELKARLDIRELPHEERGRYNTLAGLLLAISGHLPKEGESMQAGGWRFEVVDLDGRRIDKVLAQLIP
jgi:putative hemolysin